MTRPPLPDPPHLGGCLCGAARYSYNARPLAANACHCSDCKKLSGGSHIQMLIADRSAFKHETGDLKRWRKRAKSGREVDIARCAACGTRLWHEGLSAPQFVFICAGTLDDTSWFMPASHIWVECDPLYPFTPDAIRVEGQPTDRQILIDAFNRLYPSA